MKTAVYAGSFDPLTKGHLWMIEEGAKLFDGLVVAIGVNPDKKYSFSLDERLEMLRKSTRAFSNVKVASFENEYLVNYADSIGAQYMLRGIRSEADFYYERRMRNINADFKPNIATPFLMPPRELAEVSSSFVKGLVGPNGWENFIEEYVPRNVYNKVLIKNKGLQKRWNALWNSIGAKGNPSEAYHELLSLYGEPSRTYHNFVHIAHLLREVDSARKIIENPDHVEMALWYHDAVYQSRLPGNEEKSAELAQQRLGSAGVNNTFIDEVASLVLATKHQFIPQKKNEKYLVDIDLSILGKPEAEFDEYELDVREEYSWVEDDDFKKGRSEILSGFLQRDNIYSTDFFRGKYEESARKNLQRSIEKLNS